MTLPRRPSRTAAARLLGIVLLLAALAGCASNPRLQAARDFAAEAPHLAGYADLTKHFRDIYQREQPYLSPAADQRERPLDAQRHAAYADFMAIYEVVRLYMQTLGKLADGDSFDLEKPIKSLGSGIKAWPDTGLTDRHVNAYTGLTRLLAHAATEPYQERTVQAMVRDGEAQIQPLLEAMQNLLRYYDKSSDNERDIVLGMLEVEIQFADTPPERLLAALAKAHRQAKVQEYRLIGLRHTLAIKQVAAIAAAHQALAAPQTNGAAP
jgi:hypothetical protein